MTVLLSLLLLLSLSLTSSADDRKIIKLLALVPWPDSRESAGWDAGPALLPAGRIAVKLVNDNPEVLPGYRLQLIEAGHEACGLTETNMGLINFIHYASSPPQGTVAAVLGLYCSTSAIVLAHMKLPVVLKLSAANSPIFRDNHSSYPNFWRFIVSAGIYADMMLGLMDRFEWTRVAIVQDLETRFHASIAEVLAKKIIPLRNKEVVYHGGLVGIANQFFDSQMIGIVSNRARIVFVSATGPQTAKLLCFAAKRNMTYPYYLWIISDFFISSLKDEAMKLSDCQPSEIDYVLEGSLLTYFSLKGSNTSLGLSYSEYLEAYQTELSRATDIGLEHDELYAGLLFDQVWAFSLALNNSLHTLTEMNVTVENIGFNQPEVTAVLEESLSRISFRGVTGHIHFTKEKEVPGSVNIYQVFDGTRSSACTYGFQETSDNYSFIQCNLSFHESLDDDTPVRVQLIQTAIISVMFTATASTALLITFVLIFMVCYKNEPEIKASGFIMNCLIFVGCYTLCVSQVISSILAGLNVQYTLLYTVLCNVEVVTTFGGICLIFVTLFMELVRINRIFHNKRLHLLGSIYNSSFLCLMTLLLAFLPIVVQLVYISIFPFKRQEVEYYETIDAKTTLVREYCCEIDDYEKILTFRLLLSAYECVFLVLNIVLASKTRSITQRQFRNAKKVSIFMASVLVVQSVSLAVTYVMKAAKLFRYVELVTFSVSFLIAVLCQLVLFFPKVATTVNRKYYKKS